MLLLKHIILFSLLISILFSIIFVYQFKKNQIPLIKSPISQTLIISSDEIKLDVNTSLINEAKNLLYELKNIPLSISNEKNNFFELNLQRFNTKIHELYAFFETLKENKAQIMDIFENGRKSAENSFQCSRFLEDKKTVLGSLILEYRERKNDIEAIEANISSIDSNYFSFLKYSNF